jgi:hypothetical protein
MNYVMPDGLLFNWCKNIGFVMNPYTADYLVSRASGRPHRCQNLRAAPSAIATHESAVIPPTEGPTSAALGALLLQMGGGLKPGGCSQVRLPSRNGPTDPETECVSQHPYTGSGVMLMLDPADGYAMEVGLCMGEEEGKTS